MSTDLEPVATAESTACHEPSAATSHPENAIAAESAFGLTAGDRRFLMSLSAILLLLMGIHLLRFSLPGQGRLRVERADSRRFEFQIDVNQATWVEWMQLPEVGEALARKIVTFRKEAGPFRSVEDVDRVPGIGPATMQQIRPFLKWTAQTAIGHTESTSAVGDAVLSR
jgi:competence protein ComEA